MSQMIQRKQTKRFQTKTFFILSVLLLTFSLWTQPKIVQAQWADNEGNLTTGDNVGIGTTSPTAKLDVVGLNNGSSVRFTANTNADVAGAVFTVPGVTNWSLGNRPSGAFVLNNGNIFAGTDLITVLPGGNVGIGTTEPTKKLDVRGSVGIGGGVTHGNGLTITSTNHSAANHTTAFQGPASGTNDLVWFDLNRAGGAYGSFDISGNGATFVHFPMASLTAPGYINTPGNFYFNSGGNVGIGTATPEAKLSVHGANSNAETVALSLYPASSGGMPAYGIGMGPTANEGYLTYRSGTGNGDIFGHKFFVNNVEVMRMRGDGNVGIGTSNPATKLHVVGDITVTGNIAAKYQDVAEWVTSPRAMPAGTVVILHPDQTNQVLPSIKAYDTRVAGVISEMPGILLGEAGEDKVKVATTGRVKVKVDATKGPVKVGDLLVTSDKEGIAMKSEPLDLGGVPIHRPGTLIGKALEPLKEGEGEILVLLSLQ